MVFVVFLFDFGIVQTVWYLLFFYLILELFRQCGIVCFSIRFWNCSDSVVLFVFLLDFRIVQTSVVLFVFLLDFGIVQTSVVLFVFLLDFRIVQTVWYLLFFYLTLELFRQCGIVCFSLDHLTFFVHFHQQLLFLNLMIYKQSQFILLNLTTSVA